MFLEKFHRFVRHYKFTFIPRKLQAAPLPLIDKPGRLSILDALQQFIAADKANETRENGDVIEMLSANIDMASGAVAILLHRASPEAADPMYRRKIKRAVSVRTVNRQIDEEQSVSAHLIIIPNNNKFDTFDAILEEIPGISMTLIRPIIGRAMAAYTYGFKDKRGRDDETYLVFKPRGVKSESVSNALRTGNFGQITLSRPAKATFIDADDTFEAKDEKMKIRIKKDIEPKDWIDKIGRLAKSARASGWEDFQIDIELDDERVKRIPISRGEEAKEILFIRSLEVNVKKALPACSTAINDEFVKVCVVAI